MTEWNMVAILKIMPENPDIDLEKIKESLKTTIGDQAEVHTIKDVPIAFGLSAIELTLLMSDKTGGIEELQDKFSQIDGVGEVEVTDLNRL